MSVGPLVLGHLAHADLDAGHAGEAADAALDVVADLGAEGQPAVVRAISHADDAVFVDVDVADHAEVDDAGVQLGVDDGLEHPPDLFGRGSYQRFIVVLLNRWSP